MWWIQGRRGKKIREDIHTGVLEIPPDLDEFLCISHYDDKALEEIDNGNYVMKGYNGKLDYIKFRIPTVKLFED